MKLAAPLVLALLAACATTGGGRAEPARPRPDLVSVSRAMTTIDAAERAGTIAEERQLWSSAAQASPDDAGARFLAIYAQPAGEDRWAEFKALSTELPESAFGQLGMAHVYLGWRTLDQADRAIAAALELEPDSWLAVLLRAAISDRRGDRAAAAVDYRTVLGADPENPEAHAGLARLAQNAGDPAAARAEAEAALAAAPDHQDALRLLAELAERDGQVARAVELWTRAVGASPRERDLRVRLAKLLRASGDAARARDEWKAALRLREDAEGLVALAEAARAAGDAATELRAIERLSQVEPAGAEWLRIAEIRLAASDWDGAEKALRRALARDAREPSANLALARVHVARGEPRAAVEALRSAGEKGRDDLAGLERRLNLERVATPDVAALQRAVQGLVDRTFRARVAEVPSLSGELKLRVTVDPSGAATLVEVVEDSVHDADVSACAYWNLKDAAYPSNKPGRYSFAFAFRR